MESKGIEALGNLMVQQTQRIFNGNERLVACLGSVNGDLSLAIDGMGGDVPKGQYMVSLHLTRPETVTSAAADGHTHEVSTELRGLKGGDRVLVVFAGKEPVVTDIVMSS